VRPRSHWRIEPYLLPAFSVPFPRLKPETAQPEETLPIHPTLGQDWDTAPTAIDWPRLRAFLRTVKRIARIPDDHSSHDHLNEHRPVPLSDAVAARCQAEISVAQKEIEAASGVPVVWGLVDGFLLYWDKVHGSRSC
jgi:nicotinamide/nicotinate riboside kinase